MGEDTKNGAEEPSDVQRRLLDAAEQCFDNYGLAKTTMEDVAKFAGMSRATVYRHFKNRDELLLGVIEREARQTANEIKTQLQAIEDPGEYMVEGIVQALIEIPKRSALSILFRDEGAGAASRFVIPSERLASIALDVALPMMEKAKETGHLRENVDTQIVIEWIFRLLTSYLAVPSSYAKTPDQLRELFRTMLLPALLE